MNTVYVEIRYEDEYNQNHLLLLIISFSFIISDHAPLLMTSTYQLCPLVIAHGVSILYSSLNQTPGMSSSVIWESMILGDKLYRIVPKSKKPKMNAFKT